MTQPILQLTDITKRFGPLLANDGISLSLGRGEVLALLGENGAGKTTLMNVLFGHYRADRGEVRVMGRPLPPGRPRAAIEAGVGMVHQHFALAGNLTVLDNVLIGTEPLWRLRSRRAQGRARLLAAADRFGLPVDPDARVADLSVGERQRVEILKALLRDARILVLDEPTAVLAAPEAETLFARLRAMTADGLSVIVITHKLHEVMAASDRVAVLRGGRLVAERATGDTTPAELAELMVGARVRRPRREAAGPPGEPVLVAEGVSLTENGRALLDDASLEVRAGEILGIVGVSGNGQAALGRLVAGLARPTAGRLRVLGVEAGTPRALGRAGLGRIPEDREAEGMVPELAVWENAVLDRLRDGFARAGLVRRGAARTFARGLIERFDVRGATPDTRTGLLSGGNMQKLILGRALAGEPRLLLAAQPTRGLDEGAVAAVHARLLAARAAGAGVLLITEDLDEALALADRLQAIVGGRLSAPVPADEADPRRLGLMMAGAWAEAADAA